MKDKKRILNEDITATRVQLITDDWENLGEMSINDARIRAKETSLDLMELGKVGKVSIVKMLDYGKFLYKQKKQEKKSKVAGKAPDIKTLKITFKISEHDLDVRVNQAEKFAKVGHPLKLMLMLKWRENHYSEIAREKMELFINKVQDFYKVDGKLTKTGNTFLAMLKVVK